MAGRVGRTGAIGLQPSASSERLPLPTRLPASTISESGQSASSEELFQAIQDGNVDAVSRLLQGHSHLLSEHAPPLVPCCQNQCNSLGRSPLMEAMRLGHDELTQLLLDAHADINAQDQLGKTAPMYAIEFGHGSMSVLRDESTIKTMKLTITDIWGVTLLMYRCEVISCVPTV
jgi:hypothetical protein